MWGQVALAQTAGTVAADLANMKVIVDLIHIVVCQLLRDDTAGTRMYAPDAPTFPPGVLGDVKQTLVQMVMPYFPFGATIVSTDVAILASVTHMNLTVAETLLRLSGPGSGLGPSDERWLADLVGYVEHCHSELTADTRAEGPAPGSSDRGSTGRRKTPSGAKIGGVDTPRARQLRFVRVLQEGNRAVLKQLVHVCDLLLRCVRVPVWYRHWSPPGLAESTCV